VATRTSPLCYGEWKKLQGFQTYPSRAPFDLGSTRTAYQLDDQDKGKTV
jgi:hypothetical protein